MPSNTKYVSVDRLSEFLTQLKAKLAANTSSSFPVAMTVN